MNWKNQTHLYSPNGKYDWNQSHAQVPVVDCVDETTWRIYYSTRDAQNISRTSFIEVAAGNPSQILYEHEQPILPLGKLGSFDEHGIMPSCIITVGEKKYLYYIGWSQKKSVPYQNSIGLAISTDGGRSFEKYSEGPIIGINPVDPYFTGTIFVLPDGEIFRAYYLSCVGWKMVNERAESLYVLKYAESADGINWNRENIIAVPFKDEHEGGIVSATVLKTAAGYRMWFAHRAYFDFRTNPANSYRIGYADSSDGIRWNRNDAEAGIDVSASGWYSEMISYPYIVQHREKYFLFYNGNGFGKTGFGFAESDSI